MKAPRLNLTTLFVLLAPVLGLGTGCASIVHGGNRSITIATTPAGAQATVVATNSGQVVRTGTTPLTVSLDPKAGYFRGQSYTIKLDLAGHRATEVQLTPTLSPWYFGNLLLGGLIGMVVVDPLTGSMWNLSPDKIEQHLDTAQAALLRRGEGFMVVMVSQLTERERAAMVRVN